MDKIETGLIAIEVPSIINRDKIVESLGEKNANKIECKNSKDKKSITETVEKYKKIRTPLKKERAAANKQMKEKMKDILGEFDEVIGLVSNYIEPYQSVIDEYDAEVKQRKLDKLKKETANRIAEVNQFIEDMNDTFNYRIADIIMFSESWAKNTKVAFEYIETVYRNAEYSFKRIKDTVFTVKTICKKLKNEYDLQSELNYRLVLRDKLYTEDLETIEKILEDFAAEQKITEIEAIEKNAEFIERVKKVEKETLKTEKVYTYKITSKKAIDIDYIMNIDGVTGVELI